MFAPNSYFWLIIVSNGLFTRNYVRVPSSGNSTHVGHFLQIYIFDTQYSNIVLVSIFFVLWTILYIQNHLQILNTQQYGGRL